MDKHVLATHGSRNPVTVPSIRTVPGEDFFKLFREVLLNLASFHQRRPRQKFLRNVRELEICLLSKFQLRTTFGGRKNTEKPKRKIWIFGQVRFDRFDNLFESIDIASEGRCGLARVIGR